MTFDAKKVRRGPNAPKIPVPLEHEEQVLVIDTLLGRLFRNGEGKMVRPPGGGMTGRWPDLSLLYAVPNGGHRMKATAGKMRAEGLRGDVPDLCLPVVRGPFAGLYIEMKRQKGELANPQQRAYHDRLRDQGYFVFVARGAVQGISAIVGYLQLPEVGAPGGLVDVCARGLATLLKTRTRYAELLSHSAQEGRTTGIPAGSMPAG